MILLLVLACGGAGDTAAADEDSGSDAAALYSPETCATAPTWDGQVHGLLLTHCAGCHAASTPDRYGAPESASFDTQAEAREWGDRLRVRVIEQQDMPPAGGLTAAELEGLDLWLGCP